MRVTISTSWGDIVVDADNGYACSCRLPCLRRVTRVPFEVGAFSATGAGSDSSLTREVERYMRDCFAGRASKPPPFKIPEGTRFQRDVWKRLLRIPVGQTRSYGEIAHGLGRPRAARAVGRACGANPLPLIIPCHRVVAANGGLGGFTGGLAWKTLFLEREQG